MRAARVQVLTVIAPSLLAMSAAMTAGAQMPPAGSTGKSLAASAGVLTYPAKGQKPDQQLKDESECYEWSKRQSGYDPMSPPPAPAPAQPAQAQQSTGAEGARARGAVRGAAAGAVIGAVADDAGKGAAIGGTLGVLAGGRQSRMAQSQQQQQQAQQAQASEAQAQAAQQELATTFRHGMAVCLESRGYTVSVRQ